MSGSILVTRYFTLNRAPTVQATAGVDPQTTRDRIDINVVQTNIDKGLESMTLELRTVPRGSFRDQAALVNSASVNFKLTVSGTAGDVVFPQGTPIKDVTTILGLRGPDTEYPFDDHFARLTISAAELADGEAGQKPLPVRLVFAAATQDFGVTATSLGDLPDEIGILIDISRSPITIAWATVMMVIYWSMTLTVLTVVGLVFVDRIPFRFDYVLVTVTLVFAFVAFRNTAPGDPPLGSLLDYLAFFWAELFVASSAVALLLFHLFAHPRTPDQEPAPTDT